MSRRGALIGSIVVAAALALAAASLAVALTRDAGPSTTANRSGSRLGAIMGYGDGMMMGDGDAMPMMGGAWRGGSARTGVSADDIAGAAQRIERWLAAVGFDGFRVGEVMAFAWNDYAVVRDDAGKPAFELLASADAAWLMLEPPSMMWNDRYGMMSRFGSGRDGASGYWNGMMDGGMMGSGMMGGGMMGGAYAPGSPSRATLDETAAAEAAAAYLKRARPQESVEGGVAFPGYFTFDTARDGKTSGMLSVDAVTGSVWYHTWHGTFLAEREF
jgi:hypothetical protein